MQNVFAFFSAGHYCLYKASTVLNDVASTQFGNIIDLRRS
ncbi:hypothetical protein WALBB_360001 [Wolbachia pipientis wAlbB]|nr:hypothetical protein WALBB_360001 [Wolbachia pipientis wAlbB]